MHGSVSTGSVPRYLKPRLNAGLPIGANKHGAHHNLKSPLRHTLDELQNIIAQMLADPDMSQDTVFRFCAPLFSFVSLLLAAVVLTQNKDMQAWVADASNNKWRLGTAFVGLASGVLVALVLLRFTIWVVATGVRMFAEGNWRNRKRDTPGLFELVSNGGLFM